MTAQAPAARHWIGLLTLVVVWGSSYALIEWALLEFTPAQLTSARLFLGFVMTGVLVALVLRRPPPRFGRGTLVRLFGIACFGNVFPFFLISWGQTRISSAMAGVLMAVMPLTVLVFAALFLPHERLNRKHWIGFILGFLGLVVLFVPSLHWPPTGPLIAQLAVLGGACCYGITVVISRTLQSVDPWWCTVVVLAFAATMMAPWLPVRGIEGLHPGSIVAVGVLGLVSTGLASVVYFFVVRATSAAFVSLINYLIPVWALLLGVAWLGERLPASAPIALTMVLLGIAISRRRVAKFTADRPPINR